jgi:hypothetical protein
MVSAPGTSKSPPESVKALTSSGIFRIDYPCGIRLEKEQRRRENVLVEHKEHRTDI